MATLLARVVRVAPLRTVNRVPRVFIRRAFASTEVQELPPRDSDQFDIVIVGAGVSH